MYKVCIIFGLPGAGKGVCAQELKKKNYIHFSLGDYLRSEVSQKTKIGISNMEAISSGLSLIPCDVTFNIVRDIINNAIMHNKNIVIDGFPRTIYQLRLLKNFLIKKNIIPYWIYFDAGQEVAISRLLTREYCAYCKHDFIMVITKEKGKCDFCRQSLIKRATDNKESILKRINFFYETTYKVIEYLQTTSTLMTLNSNKSFDYLKKEFLKIEETLK